MKTGRMERLRKGLVLLSIGVTSYYLYWRTGTFNPDAPLFSAILYAAEVYGFITSLMFFFMVWNLKERRTRPAPPGYRVDVFIPTLNEDLETLEKTIKGCLNMRYPHRTYVLDDGNRRKVRELCEKLGCYYIARKDNKHAKAGNLNHALTRTDGDLIAIFDADHVPEPDFLEKTLGYFWDERVAFVQTPQDFYNVDSYQHRIVRGKLWHEQSLFFKVIMRGKDRHNATFFCGSCAVIRRKALEDIGGFATGTVTEDIHTSIRLHAKGWKSVYHPETLAYGVAPSTMKPFKTQRERWGQGAMQVLLRDNPLWVRGLTIKQRINYIASMTTYFDGFQKLIYYVAPVVVLLTGTFPISVSLAEFLPIFIPHMVLSIWAFEEMSRGYGKFLLLEQYNMARFVSFMKSVIGFFRFGKLGFRVTDKKVNGNSRFREVIPQFLVFVLSLTGIVWAIVNFPKLVNRDLYLANMFWALINLGLATGCVAWTLGKKQLRRDFRFPANFPARISVNGAETPATIEDLHEKGCAIIAGRSLERGDEVSVRVHFLDEELEVEGTVLYSKPFDGMPLYRLGILFHGVHEGIRDKIREFNFRFLLKKYMEEMDRPPETPMQKVARWLSGEFWKRRSKRKKFHVPGMVLSGEGFVPYTTEDLGEKGLRILTYRRIKRDQVMVHIGSSIDERVVSGRVVWEKEIYFYGIRAFRYGIRIEDQPSGEPGAREPVPAI